MPNPLTSLAPLSRGGAAAGRLARLEAAVDRLARFCAGLRGGRGISLDFDGEGAPTIAWTAKGGGTTVENYAFRVEAEGGSIHVAAGTAQVWGGTVKGYNATTFALGSGGWVYASCNLAADPPAWANALVYGNMANQTPTSLWIPLAEVAVSSGVATVTQCHWGNIVVPALANVVDVQS